MSVLELHPLCTYFPRMSNHDFDALKSDIKANGQLHPIFILDGMILDGGNRYRALTELGIEPICAEYTGTNPVQFVLSSNLHRRHLTQGQAATIVSATQDWAKAHPAHRVEKEARNVAGLNSVADRAKESGAGHRTQEDADKLVKNASQEVIKQVTNGEKSLNKALIDSGLKASRKPATLPLDEVPEPHEEETDLWSIINELQEQVKYLETENALLHKTIDSDDAAATLAKEAMVLTATNNALNSRLNGMNAERTAMIGRIKWLERQLKKHAPAAPVAPTDEVDCWE